MRDTANVSASVAPGLIEPSLGSDRMSERFNRSSTKYGPSVISGRTTHDASPPPPSPVPASLPRAGG